MIDNSVLFASLALVVLTVAAASALRNFRWSRLERLIGDEDRLKGLKDELRRERELLDALQIVRIVASLLLVLALIGLLSPGSDRGPEADPGRFLANMGWALLIFLGGIYGVIRGVVRAAPERTLLIVLPPARILARLVAPLLFLTDGLGRIFTRAAGLDRKESDGEEARDEILDAVSEGEREGAIEEDEREMIENIIEVQDQAVTEIMTPRTSVFAMSIDTSFDEAVALVVEKGHSRIPVYEDNIDNVIGVLYAKDLLAYWSRRDGSLPEIRELLRDPVFIPETKKTSDLFEQFRRDKIHMAILLDEYGGMSGIVTIEDVIEEIVGEIEDEYDRKKEGEETLLKRLNARESEVAPVMHIDDLNDAQNVQIPKDNGYDTLGGFLFSRMGRVPQKGDSWSFENLRFEILEADARRIHRVKVVVAE